MAIKEGYDWLWIHDDDAFVYKDTIKKLKESINSQKDINNISAICAAVYEDDNNIAYDHRRRLKKTFLGVKETSVNKYEYNKDNFEINIFSYVGIALNVDKLFQVGLDNKDLFIYFDDSSHSYRLSKVGKIVCYPRIKILHANKYKNTENHDATWQMYYYIRNSIYFYKYVVRKGTSKLIINNKKRAIFRLLYRKDNDGYKEINQAIKDGLKCNLGINDVYKPGWKPHNYDKKEESIKC